ncbi:MAG: serine/threonine-protein kinase [Acidobacteriota bacterium]
MSEQETVPDPRTGTGAASLAGQVIDGFQVESLLGAGGMGEVWKARDARLDRHVALKIVAEPYARDREFRARFEREARAASALNHPNVAQVYSFGEYSGRPYYAMEYVEGQSLADILKQQGRISGLKCLEYLAQACAGLRAALEKGIVHRDIKPANLMLDPKGFVKIVDFGLARRMADPSTITRTDAVIGTPNYMSPEQAVAAEVDHRSDIYSLGATFYHLFAGEPPFEAPTPIALIMKHVEEPLRPLKQCNPRVPTPVCSIIEKMMSKRPDDRYQDYDELLADIGRAEAGKSVVDATGAMEPQVRAMEPSLPRALPSRGQWIPVALIGALALLLALLALERMGILGFSFMGSSREGRSTSQPVPASSEGGLRSGSGAASPAGPGSVAGGKEGAGGIPWPFNQIEEGTVAYQSAMRAKTLASMKRLSTLIAMYTSERGMPLLDVAELRSVDEGYAYGLKDGWGGDIRYERMGELGYRLVSPGPDGSLGTGDDIILESPSGGAARVRG